MYTVATLYLCLLWWSALGGCRSSCRKWEVLTELSPLCPTNKCNIIFYRDRNYFLIAASINPGLIIWRDTFPAASTCNVIFYWTTHLTNQICHHIHFPLHLTETLITHVSGSPHGGHEDFPTSQTVSHIFHVRSDPHIGLPKHGFWS